MSGSDSGLVDGICVSNARSGTAPTVAARLAKSSDRDSLSTKLSRTGDAEPRGGTACPNRASSVVLLSSLLASPWPTSGSGVSASLSG